jgi:hypothetical protein
MPVALRLRYIRLTKLKSSPPLNFREGQADKTTVVHLEDYKNNTIITSITEPDGTFSKFHGQMKLIS